MKIRRSFNVRGMLFAGLMLTSAFDALAQQPFYNLDFESATGIPDRPGPQGYYSLDARKALPSWNAFIRGHPDLWLTHNYHDDAVPGVALFGPAPFGPGDEQFSIGLKAGILPFIGNVGASIAQTGQVPWDALSLQLRIHPGGENFSVALGGTAIPLVSLSMTDNYILYGGDVSAFAGMTKELTIAVHGGESRVILDSIAFSPVPVPDPASALILVFGCVFLVALKIRKRMQRG